LPSNIPIAIVGAGPYGMALAAHLRAHGMPFRIFGQPMHSWRTQMPEGMLLKSEGFASSISDPDDSFPLARFCAERNIPYADIGLPVPIGTFIDYGMEFQRRYVPELETRLLRHLAPGDGDFGLRLDDGETFRAKQVVVAVGVGHFPFLPRELAVLPTHVSHSSEHSALGAFRDRDVIVVGAGASAVDLAALLHQQGARVRLVARRRSIDFHAPPEQRRRRLSERLRAPRSGLGLGWRSRLCEDAPLLFRVMPRDFRHRVVQRHLGPAPGWFVREQVEGHVPMLLGARLLGAEAHNGTAVLRIAQDAGGEQVLEAEHIIAATGYRVDLRRLDFASPELLARVEMVEHTPVLSSRFETSLPGLFFIGPAAANCFGPLMRFACGNRFVARRVAPYMARTARR